MVSKKSGVAAAGLAAQLINYLRTEQGQKQLRRVPHLIRWVRAQRDDRSQAIDATSRVGGTRRSGGIELDDETTGALALPVGRPGTRLGRRALINGQRLRDRMERVRRTITLAFDEDAPQRATADETFAELERTLSIADGLPLTKRVRLHWRVDQELQGLEDALFRAASKPKS